MWKRSGLIFSHAVIGAVLVCWLRPCRAQAEPLDLSDPTPRSIEVEFEVSLNPSDIGTTYSVAYDATYSASGNTGTVVISSAEYETAILTGDLDYFDFLVSQSLISGTATDFTLSLDLTTLEAVAATLTYDVLLATPGPQVGTITRDLKTDDIVGFNTVPEFPGFPFFCSTTCVFVSGASYDPITGAINAVGKDTLVSPNIDVSSFGRSGDLRLSEIESPPADPAEGFSIDSASPSVSAGSNSAILSSGPIGGPPNVVVTPGSLGLAGGGADEIDAISFGAGAPELTFHFSVDGASVGLAGDVVAEAAAGQAAGDMFATGLSGENSLVINQRSLGLDPPTVPGTSASHPVDELDAFDFSFDDAGGLIVYSLQPGHPLTGTAVGCGGDIFFAGSLFVGYPALGLGSCTDDVDALEVDTTSNTFFYSLAPGSPSLSAGSPISGCAAGCSAADIFSAQGGAASLFATASALGLLTSDNVDALSLTGAPAAVPALESWGAILLVGLLVAIPLSSWFRRGGTWPGR